MSKMMMGAGLALSLVVACGSEDDGGTGAPFMGSASAGPATTAPDGDDDDGAATGDPDEDTGGGMEPDPDPATSGPATTGPAEDTGMVTVGDPDDGGSNDPAVQMCLDQAANECEDCACMSCLPQLQACEQDPGCVAIRMCAQQSGCTGIECLGPCGDVINANGGALGPSAGLASALSDCVEGSCPAC